MCVHARTHPPLPQGQPFAKTTRRAQESTPLKSHGFTAFKGTLVRTSQRQRHTGGDLGGSSHCGLRIHHPPGTLTCCQPGMLTALGCHYICMTDQLTGDWGSMSSSPLLSGSWADIKRLKAWGDGGNPWICSQLARREGGPGNPQTYNWCLRLRAVSPCEVCSHSRKLVSEDTAAF